MLHRIRLHQFIIRKRQFTNRQPLPDIQITPQEWKPDSEMSTKNDDLYARTWQCEIERPIFDAENNNVTPPNSPENSVRSTKESGTHQEPYKSVPRKIFPKKEELCDVTDTYHYMEPDAETN